MMIPPESCRDEQRRADVRARHGPDRSYALNGIDYIDVGSDRRSLTIHFLHEVPRHLTAANVRIDGGRRITGIKVLPFHVPERHRDTKPPRQITIRVDREGDFSPYTLRLVEPDAHGRPGETPLGGFDPYFAQDEFSFKVDCPTDLDCGAAVPCAPAPVTEPEIDYLTKDYAGFRQLMLDRLSLIAPAWQERHAADLGIALIEVLAYVGDHLSYLQDAVATEAYLGTAHRRISVRRHARLVDYVIGEGCNARAWVWLQAARKADLDLRGTRFLTERIAPGSSTSIGFEVLSPRTITVYPEHNEIKLYTWGNRECCLPRGATSATLWGGPAPSPPAEAAPAEAPPAPARGAEPHPAPRPAQAEAGHPARGPDAAERAEAHNPRYKGQPKGKPPGPPAEGYGEHPPKPSPPRDPTNPPLYLKPGDVLIFEEVIGPRTGQAADADPHHRHVVRLTGVERVIDPLKNDQVYEVEWATEDRLPFTLCISTLGDPPLCEEREDVSVARGNVVLVDHGLTTRARLDVPGAAGPTSRCVAKVHAAGIPATPQPFRPPPLPGSPVTHSAVFPGVQSVAVRQARLLAGLMDRVYAVLPDLVAQVKATQQPLGTTDFDRLAVIFGVEELADVGLVDEETGDPLPLSAHVQLRRLNRLLARERRALAKKAHRVDVLTQYARSGYVLTESQGREIGAMFGLEFAKGLDPENPQWLGPARDATAQDPRAALPAISLRAFDPAAEGPVYPELSSPFPGRTDLLAAQARILDTIDRGIKAVGASLIGAVDAGDLPLHGDPLAEAETLFRAEFLGELGLIETDDDSSPNEDASARARRLADRLRRIPSLQEYVAQGFVLTPDEVRELVATFAAAAEFSGEPPEAARGLWCPRPDLLSSRATDRHFVAEIDDDGRANLRFGDGDLGQSPPPGQALAVTYRVGNGVAGNVPAGTITAIDPQPDEITGVRNPLPATGGIDPEPIAQVKMFAPGDFRSQKRRAITAADYAEIAGRNPGVQGAAASVLWTGGLREVRVAIDPLGTEDPDPALIDQVEADLQRYRRIDHDVHVVPARYVALDVALEVVVQPQYLTGHVEADLLRFFSNTINPDGTKGMFHPDNLTFGQDITLSRLVSAAQGVAGVRSVTVTRLRRLGDPPPAGGVDLAIIQGILQLGPLEVPRLDNDPNFPEQGTFRMTLRGGR